MTYATPHNLHVEIREMKKFFFIRVVNDQTISIFKYANFYQLNNSWPYRCSDSYSGDRFWCFTKATRVLNLDSGINDGHELPEHNLISIIENENDVEIHFISYPDVPGVDDTYRLKLHINDKRSSINCAAENNIPSDVTIDHVSFPYQRFCASYQRQRRMIGILHDSPKVISKISLRVNS